MASSRSLGVLTIDLIAKIGGLIAGMDKAARHTENRSRQIKATIKSLSAGITTAFAGFGIANGINDAIQLGDEMGKLAQKTGLTAKAASELSRVFQQNDLDNQILTNALRNMQIELSKGNPLFAKLGLNLEELRKKSPDEVFEILAQRISEVGNANDRAAYAAGFFGKKIGTELLPVLLLGKAGIEDLRKELGGLSNEDVADLQQADDAIKKLGFLKQSFWNEIAIGAANFAKSIGLIEKSAASPMEAELERINGGIERTSKLIDKLTMKRGGVVPDAAVADQIVGGSRAMAGQNIAQLRATMDELVKSRQEVQAKLDELRKTASGFDSEDDASLSIDTHSEFKTRYLNAINEFDKGSKWLEDYADFRDNAKKLEQGFVDDLEESYRSFVEESSRFAFESMGDIVSGQAEQNEMRLKDQQSVYNELMSQFHLYKDDVVLTTEQMYEQIAQYEKSGALSAIQAAAIRVSVTKAANQELLDTTSNMFGALSSLTSSKSKELFRIGKAAAVAEATVSATKTIIKAFDAPTWYEGIAQGLSAAATLYSRLDQLKSIEMTGFQSGGYTGSGGASQVAGVVHRGEYVFDAASTARMGVGNLEALRSGGGMPNVSVYNYGSSSVRVEQPSRDEINIMIDQAIQTKTPRLVAAQMSNPNSTVSRSFSNNTNAARRR